MKTHSLGLAAIVTLAGLTACKGNQDSSTNAAASGIKIGLVTDVGGRGDESFNDSALRGLETWAADKKYTASGYQPLPANDRAQTIPASLKDASIAPLGVSPVVLTSKAQEDYEPNLDLLAKEKVRLAVGLGFMLENAIESAAKKHPETNFLLIDSQLLDAQNKPYTLPNVQTVVFRENEGSFLIGALAALATKNGKVGFVGGMELPIIKKFEAGFIAGVKMINAQAADEAKRVYTGNFDDSASGKRAGLDLYNQGVEIVYAAAGAGGIGVIQAAKEQGKLALGCDSDQAHLAPQNVLSSSIKHVDYAVYTAVKSTTAGSFQSGDRVLGLKEGGVDIAPVTLDFPNKQAALAKLEKLRKAVVDGQVKVPRYDSVNRRLA